MIDPSAALQKIKPLLSPAVIAEIKQRLKQFQEKRVGEQSTTIKRTPVVTTPMVMRPNATPRPLNRSYFTL